MLETAVAVAGTTNKFLASDLAVCGDLAMATVRCAVHNVRANLTEVSDERRDRLDADCRALLFPGEEDFGIVPLEAMACGRPVIAYRSGGALDTVVEGETGCFFARQTVEDLATAILRFERRESDGGAGFDPQAIRRHARGFGRDVFRSRLKSFIDTCLTEAAAGRRGAQQVTAFAEAAE